MLARYERLMSSGLWRTLVDGNCGIGVSSFSDPSRASSPVRPRVAMASESAESYAIRALRAPGIIFWGVRRT